MRPSQSCPQAYKQEERGSILKVDQRYIYIPPTPSSIGLKAPTSVKYMPLTRGYANQQALKASAHIEHFTQLSCINDSCLWIIIKTHQLLRYKHQIQEIYKPKGLRLWRPECSKDATKCPRVSKQHRFWSDKASNSIRTCRQSLGLSFFVLLLQS